MIKILLYICTQKLTYEVDGRPDREIFFEEGEVL